MDLIDVVLHNGFHVLSHWWAPRGLSWFVRIQRKIVFGFFYIYINILYIYIIYIYIYIGFKKMVNPKIDVFLLELMI